MRNCMKSDGDYVEISIRIPQGQMDHLFDRFDDLADKMANIASNHCHYDGPKKDDGSYMSDDSCCCHDEDEFAECPEDDYYPEDNCHEGWRGCTDADPGDEICECDEFVCNRTKHTRRCKNRHCHCEQFLMNSLRNALSLYRNM